MRQMKVNKERPWLTSTGVEIPTLELREIAKAWRPSTWEAYLKWYGSGCREKLVTPGTYSKICDELEESLFDLVGHDSSPEMQADCERLLNEIPDSQARVLRKIFFEGKTVREISSEVGLPKSTVHDLKSKGISRLKRGNEGDGSDTRQFMRGESSSPLVDETSIWDEPLAEKIKEARVYDPENHQAEFEAIKSSCVRVALMELPELARRVLYLRYWCDLSVNQTARILKRGVNVIEQIESASISKVKRGALAFETGTTFGGAQC